MAERPVIGGTVGMETRGWKGVGCSLEKRHKNLLFGPAAGPHAVSRPVVHHYQRTAKSAHVLRAFITTVFMPTDRRVLYQQRSKGVKTFFPPTTQVRDPQDQQNDGDSMGRWTWFPRRNLPSVHTFPAWPHPLGKR